MQRLLTSMVVTGPMRQMLLDHPSAVPLQLQRREQTQLHGRSDLRLDLMLLSWQVMKGVPSWAAVQLVRWMGTAPSGISIKFKISCVNVFFSVS